MSLPRICVTFRVVNTDTREYLRDLEVVVPSGIMLVARAEEFARQVLPVGESLDSLVRVEEYDLTPTVAVRHEHGALVFSTIEAALDYMAKRI